MKKIFKFICRATAVFFFVIVCILTIINYIIMELVIRNLSRELYIWLEKEPGEAITKTRHGWGAAR